MPAWVLFGIVFLWQIPHFFAIAWLYQDDYARAGFPLLPVIEPDGLSTARQVMLYGTALLPMSLAPGLVGIAGPPYMIGAAALSIGFLLLSGRFAWQRDLPSARCLFVGSIIYLPLLWGLMVANRLPGGAF
jgi:protoheme IX farnesyltransferase